MTDYSVGKLYVQSDGKLQLWLQPVIATDSQSLVLHVGSDTFAFEDADVKEANKPECGTVPVSAGPPATRLD